MIENSSGKIFYGLHFYPGLAEYQEGEKSHRVFLNEDTLRKMDPTFAGKPIFVDHVDGVDAKVDNVRKEADGWVVESFFNEADGKHWVKMVLVTERAFKAIEAGMRLSNAYLPKGPMGPAGMWNGLDYDAQIMNGEYEHLAIVNNPRYEESRIMTPEQFKAYNEEKKMELKRIANSKTIKGESKMGLNFFKKAKVENGADLESTMVTLGKSKKDVTIAQAIEIADKYENMAGYADEGHMVKVGNEEMSVGDLVKKHMDVCNKMMEMENASKEGKESEVDMEEKDVEVEGDKHNEESEDEAKEDLKKDKKNEDEEDDKKAKDEKKKNNFDAIKDAEKEARKNSRDEVVVIDTYVTRLARGKQRYGSAK